MTVQTMHGRTVPVIGTADPVLELRNIWAGYGETTVLRGVDLVVPPSSVVAVLGPNGAGKSTLLKTILGVVPATQGTVVFDRTRVTHESPSGRFLRGIALSPEGRRIFMNLSVAENLVTGASGVGSDVVARQTERIFELFPVLHERQGQRAGSLSGGEQQMLAIGRALVSAPRLLMIDELSMGLAPLVVAELYETLRTLADEGLAVVVVDQFASKMLAVADRACVVEKGRIVLDGTGELDQAELLAGAAVGLDRK
jgi:branched-chain amino acid transport system ATP-binding protein